MAVVVGFQMKGFDVDLIRSVKRMRKVQETYRLRKAFRSFDLWSRLPFARRDASANGFFSATFFL